jgi:hypothetical protein
LEVSEVVGLHGTEEYTAKMKDYYHAVLGIAVPSPKAVALGSSAVAADRPMV